MGAWGGSWGSFLGPFSTNESARQPVIVPPRAVAGEDSRDPDASPPKPRRKPGCLPGHNGAPTALKSTLTRRGRVRRGQFPARCSARAAAPRLSSRECSCGSVGRGSSFGYNPRQGLVGLKGAGSVHLGPQQTCTAHAHVCGHHRVCVCSHAGRHTHLCAHVCGRARVCITWLPCVCSQVCVKHRTGSPRSDNGARAVSMFMSWTWHEVGGPGSKQQSGPDLQPSPVPE